MLMLSISLSVIIVYLLSRNCRAQCSSPITVHCES